MLSILTLTLTLTLTPTPTPNPDPNPNDKQAFRKALPSVGLDASRIDLEALFDWLDADGTGSITYKDLHMVHTRTNPLPDPNPHSSPSPSPSPCPHPPLPPATLT